MSGKILHSNIDESAYDYDELLNTFNNSGLVFAEKKNIIILYDKEDITVLISNSGKYQVYLVNCRNVIIALNKNTRVDITLYDCQKVVVYTEDTKYRITTILTQSFRNLLKVGEPDLYIMNDCHQDINLINSCTRVIFGTHGNVYPGAKWLLTEEPRVDYSKLGMINYLNGKEMRYDKIISNILNEDNPLIMMFVSNMDASQEFCEPPILFPEPKCLCNNDTEIVFYQMNFPQSVTVVDSRNWANRYSYTKKLPPLRFNHKSASSFPKAPQTSRF